MRKLYPICNLITLEFHETVTKLEPCPPPRLPKPPPAPLDLVIFGGAGDLSVRKLLPALYMAHLHNNLPESTRIHALGRQPWDREAFMGFVQDKVTPFVSETAREGDCLAALSWTG